MTLAKTCDIYYLTCFICIHLAKIAVLILNAYKISTIFHEKSYQKQTKTYFWAKKITMTEISTKKVVALSLSHPFFLWEIGKEGWTLLGTFPYCQDFTTLSCRRRSKLKRKKIDQLVLDPTIMCPQCQDLFTKLFQIKIL